MKTWVCCIYGGGTPLYLVYAETEKRGWELVRSATRDRFGWLNFKKETGGFNLVPNLESEVEQCIDIHDVYAPNSTIKRGTYNYE